MSTENLRDYEKRVDTAFAELIVGLELLTIMAVVRLSERMDAMSRSITEFSGGTGDVKAYAVGERGPELSSAKGARYMIGGPVGAQVGFTHGSYIGNAVDPEEPKDR